MKFIRIFGLLLPLLALLPALCLAQESDQADDIANLRAQISALERQLDGQREALESARKAIASAQKALDSQQKLLDRLVAGPVAPAAVPAQSAQSAMTPPVHPASLAVTPPVQPASFAAIPPVQPAPLAVTPPVHPASFAVIPPVQPAPPAAEMDTKGRAFSPLAFHIGGADFTPGGFMDFATAWRSTNVGSGVATSFASVPLGNTAAGRMQEFRSSAANSRITLTITENPTENLALTGYLEGDFTGNQPAGQYVTSNSSTFRMRHFYVNAAKGKWEVLGGQTWTLLTPNRVGVSPVSSNVFVGLGEDSNYMTGLIWGRPGQFRVVYHPSRQWSLAVSVENPEQYVTTATTLPAFAATQVDNGSLPTTANVRPDIVAKTAYDTRLSGKALHFELAGFSRQFRTSPAPGKYFDAQGVGGSFDAVLEVAKNFRLITTAFYSSGGGRFSVGLGPDVVVGPDGSISPVHSMAGIVGFEYTPASRSQFFAYYGGTYFDRNYTAVSAGNYLGFGFPGSSSANRQFQEPVFGHYYTIWKNPRYGALQVITEYAYLTRAPWYVAPGTPSTAHAHMVFGSLRFTLP